MQPRNGHATKAPELPEARPLAAKIPPGSTSAPTASAAEQPSPVRNCAQRAQASPQNTAAFQSAETFFHRVFLPLQITSAPKTEAIANEVLGHLIASRDKSLSNYLRVLEGLPVSRTELEIAVRVRLGETHFQMTEKLLAIPQPREVAYPSPPAGSYERVMLDLTTPFTDKARDEWERAREIGETLCTENTWTELSPMPAFC